MNFIAELQRLAKTYNFGNYLEMVIRANLFVVFMIASVRSSY